MFWRAIFINSSLTAISAVSVVSMSPRWLLLAALVACLGAPHIVAADDWDWWKTVSIYQIYPRSFQDSDGDGTGDLKGIISRMDHLKELNVGAIWMSPIFKSPMADFGYDISDFYDIDPIFGTMADFDDLIVKANQLGIKIILDFVPNHSSDESEWFVKAKANDPVYSNYYIWRNAKGFDGNGNPIPPNEWYGAFSERVWTWVPERNQYYYHYYNFKQPDLDYRNDAVRREMENVMTFWLDKGAHGFRVDTVHTLVEDEGFPDVPNSESYQLVTNQPLTYTVVKEWRKVMDNYSKRDNFTRVLMTEAYGSTAQLMDYYGTNFEPGAHFTFNFNFILSLSASSSASDFKNTINEWMLNMPIGGTPNWVIGNHDQHRVASRYGQDLAMGISMLTLMLPGVSVTYYGEEIGMEDNCDITYAQTVDPQGCNAGPDGYKDKSRDFERTSFQWDNTQNAGFSSAAETWLPVNANYPTLNLEAQRSPPRSHFNIYKKILAARSWPTFLQGTLHTSDVTANVIAISRELVDQPMILVVVNLGTSGVTVNLNNNFLRLPADLTVYTSNTASGLADGSTVPSRALFLAPHASVILNGDPTFPDCT